MLEALCPHMGMVFNTINDVHMFYNGVCRETWLCDHLIRRDFQCGKILIVIFYSIFHTNHYNMPFAPIVGETTTCNDISLRVLKP
jgi:hypothetical protein